MCNRVDTRHERLHANFFDLLPHLITRLVRIVLSVPVNVLQDRRETSFVTNVRLLLILILDKAVSFLVDGVVGQVHAQVVQIAAHGTQVLLCGKSGQALFVDEAAQGADARHQYIDTQVELESVYQVRLVEIALCNVMFALYQPVAVARQKDATTLTLLLWLHDECLRSLIVELLFEALGVRWQDPRPREKIILVGQHGLHG